MLHTVMLSSGAVGLLLEFVGLKADTSSNSNNSNDSNQNSSHNSNSYNHSNGNNGDKLKASGLLMDDCLQWGHVY